MVVGAFAVVMVVVPSCRRAPSLIIATHADHTTPAAVGTELAAHLARERGWSAESRSGPEFDLQSNVERVVSGEVDLALCSSILAVEELRGVRTVLPIYPEIMMVLYHPDIPKPASLRELLEGRRVGVGPRPGHAGQVLALLGELGVKQDTYTPVTTEFEEIRVLGDAMDVAVVFFGADPAGIEAEIRAGVRLFSLDDFELDGRGSRVDGFLLMNPFFESFVIPKNTFDRYPEEPVLTLSVTITLIAHESTSAETVYELVETILSGASSLARRHPLLGFLNYDFDATKLNFPLHDGTRHYLNRDQPGFLERYAEVIALSLSVVLLAVGALGSANRLIRRRKKDRIDVYYAGVQHLEAKVERGELGVEEAMAELQQLEKRAVVQLQQEKLEASESFSIFLDLAHHAARRLERRRDG